MPTGVMGESIDELRDRVVQQAASALDADRGYALEAVILMLLEALLRGGPFDRAVFALANAERTMVEGRLGLGAGADKLVARLRVSTRSAPVSIALEWRRAALRTVERALTDDEARWCNAVGATAFGVAPLTIDGKLVGCLYADCLSAWKAAEATGPFLETVASLTSRAIASRRRPEEKPAAATAPAGNEARSRRLSRCGRRPVGER